MGKKLERKKTEYSAIKKADIWEGRKLLLCTDVGLGRVAAYLRYRGHAVIPAEQATVNTSDDKAFLGWMRENWLIFVTRDGVRARKMLHDGLMWKRPGIVVLHSPNASSDDLLAGVEALLSQRYRYRQTWERVMYLSHGVLKVYAPDGAMVYPQ